MNKQDKARWLDQDGECLMCRDGEWPRDAPSCPVCDAEIPDEQENEADVLQNQESTP